MLEEVETEGEKEIDRIFEETGEDSEAEEGRTGAFHLARANQTDAGKFHPHYVHTSLSVTYCGSFISLFLAFVFVCLMYLRLNKHCINKLHFH